MWICSLFVNIVQEPVIWTDATRVQWAGHPHLAARFVRYENPSRIAPVFLLLSIDSFTYLCACPLENGQHDRGLVTGVTSNLLLTCPPALRLADSMCVVPRMETLFRSTPCCALCLFSERSQPS